MSRSLGPVTTVAEVERLAAESRNPFGNPPYLFEVRKDGPRRIHQISMRDDRPDGPRQVVDVHYAVGSGTRGRTYLVAREGYLVQSPISWFSTKGIWDLTPGFHVEERFERPARESCLFCHTHRVEPIPHTINRYEEPIFRGHGIGCERCHGPGERHVQARERGDHVEEFDDTIVNPARLGPLLRNAVCEQCHLQGEVRIVRRGRSLFEYRPGLPLDLFVTTFVRRPEFADAPTAGGHAEQMQESRCYQASQGKMSCTSCHDPHGVPNAKSRETHYRARCLTCHTEKSCALSSADRRARIPSDSCMECHMKPAESRIAHTAIADHRIHRLPPSGPMKPPRTPPSGEIPLRPFHETSASSPELERDLGLALYEISKTYPAMGRRLSPMALPLLESATKLHRNDVAAWEAKGFLLWQLGRKTEGATALKTALAHAPDRELTLTFAAVLATSLGKQDEAVRHWKRAIDVNPYSATYHYRLAKVLAEQKKWSQSLAACDETLKLDPLHDEARKLRDTCRREQGR
jgi:predicted CXXCH cytochrome family protein